MNTTPLEPGLTAGTPTVVLVHGAFAESASWNGVVADLKHRGYSVIAAANPLRGLQQDADYLRSVLDSLSGPVVLAGHSYGGSVMSEAAHGATGVAALVYIASFNLEVARAPPSWPPSSQEASSPPSTPCPSPPPTATPAPTSTSNRTSSGGVRRRRRPRHRRADGGHPAAHRRLRPGGHRHQGGLEDHPLLDHGHHPGPGHPARLHALHGPAGGVRRPSRSTPPTPSPSPSQARSPSSSTPPPAPPPLTPPTAPCRPLDHGSRVGRPRPPAKQNGRSHAARKL